MGCVYRFDEIALEAPLRGTGIAIEYLDFRLKLRSLGVMSLNRLAFYIHIFVTAGFD